MQDLSPRADKSDERVPHPISFLKLVRAIDKDINRHVGMDQTSHFPHAITAGKRGISLDHDKIQIAVLSDLAPCRGTDEDHAFSAVLVNELIFYGFDLLQNFFFCHSYFFLAQRMKFAQCKIRFMSRMNEKLIVLA